jgi:hypothetical protein
MRKAILVIAVIALCAIAAGIYALQSWNDYQTALRGRLSTSPAFVEEMSAACRKDYGEGFTFSDGKCCERDSRVCQPAR